MPYARNGPPWRIRLRRRGVFAEGDRFFVGVSFPSGRDVAEAWCTGCSERERFPQVGPCENGRESGRDKCSSSRSSRSLCWIYRKCIVRGKGTEEEGRGVRGKRSPMVFNITVEHGKTPREKRAGLACDYASCLVFIWLRSVHAVLSESFRCTSPSGSS